MIKVWGLAKMPNVPIWLNLHGTHNAGVGTRCVQTTWLDPGCGARKDIAHCDWLWWHITLSLAYEIYWLTKILANMSVMKVFYKEIRHWCIWAYGGSLFNKVCILKCILRATVQTIKKNHKIKKISCTDMSLMLNTKSQIANYQV